VAQDHTFDIVILNGRPAAGKSEIIDFLRSVPPAERMRRFHIGEFRELDDFPILWEQFEDDDLMEAMGHPRLLTERTFEYRGRRHAGHTFREPWYWNFLIRKLCLRYERLIRDDPGFHERGGTVFIEFARGSEHGGFREAYSHLSETVLERAVTLYIDVTWEESLRKNRRRYNPDRPDSILEHGLEDLKLQKLYKESDWTAFAGSGDSGFLQCKEQRVSFGVFRNMPEKTDDPAKIAPHLEEVMKRIHQLAAER